MGFECKRRILLNAEEDYESRLSKRDVVKRGSRTSPPTRLGVSHKKDAKHPRKYEI